MEDRKQGNRKSKDRETIHFPTTIEPQERLKHLIVYCNTIEVDSHIPPTRYYRSGLEMVRMANVYYNEGSLENAYVLYLKFMTLFLEKIRKHPDFASVPVKIKAINQAKLREVLGKAEKLKEQLLHQYQDEYNQYQRAMKKKVNVPKRKTDESKSTDVKLPTAFIDAQIPPSVQNISYPDPSAPSLDLDDDTQRYPTVPPEKSLNDYPTSDNSTISTPSVNRSTKPSDGDLYNYNKLGLRPVIVPTNLMAQFERISQRNTINNVETCGILAGKLAHNELTITHMILPKQKGTSDSCTTMNEEELFDFQDQHNLITIGWIHTHPTQTAFLSSVDLHTHCPYQLLMPEAIAIVCAPRYNETGFFVLTPDYGLQFIANCRESGFHPHPTEPPLFKVAEHIKLESGAALEVLDLRS